MADKENTPLVISRRMLTASRNIYAIVVKLQHVPGALLQVLQVIYKHKINILSLIASSVKKGDHIGSCFILIDSTNSSIGINEIVSEIRSKELVIDAKKLERPVSTLIVDNYHYPLMISDELKAFIVPWSTTELLVDGIIQTFGEDATRSFFWYIGKSLGNNLAKTWLSYGLKKEEVPIAILNTGMSLGVLKGDIKQNLQNNEVEISLYDNIECVNNKKYHQKSTFFLGFWEGMYEILLETKVNFQEISCIAIGDSKCIFKKI